MDKKNPYKAINDPGISMPNYIDACASLDQIQCIMNDLGTEGSYLGNVDFSKVPNVSGEGVKSRTNCLATSLGTHGAGCDMQGLYNNMYKSINLGINQNFNGKKTNIDFVKEYQKFKESYEKYLQNPEDYGKDYLQTMAYSAFLDAANNLNKNGRIIEKGKNGELIYIVQGENGDYIVAEKDGKILNVNSNGVDYSFHNDGTSSAIKNDGIGITKVFTDDGIRYTVKDNSGKEIDITEIASGKMPADKESDDYQAAMSLVDSAKSKDPSKWTLAETIAAAVYYDDLTERALAADKALDESGLRGYSGHNYDNMNRAQELQGNVAGLSKEKRDLESQLKAAGVLEYTSQEKAEIELTTAKEKLKQDKIDLKEAKERGDTKEVERLEKEISATRTVLAGTGIASVGKFFEGFLDSATYKQGLDKAALEGIRGGNAAAEESLAQTRDLIAEDLTGDIEKMAYNSEWGKKRTDGSLLEPLSDAQRYARNSGTEFVRNIAAVTGGFIFPQAALGVAVADATGALGGHLEENYNVTDSSGNHPLRNAKGDINAVLMAASDVGTYYPLALTGANIASSFAAMKAPYVDPSILQIGNGTPISSKALAPQFNPAVLNVSQAAGATSNIITGSTLDPNWTSKDTRDQIFRTGAAMGATSFASWAIPKMLIDLKVPVIPGIKGSSQALMVQNPATMSIAGANYVPQSIAAASGAITSTLIPSITGSTQAQMVQDFTPMIIAGAKYNFQNSAISRGLQKVINPKFIEIKALSEEEKLAQGYIKVNGVLVPSDMSVKDTFHYLGINPEDFKMKADQFKHIPGCAEIDQVKNPDGTFTKEDRYIAGSFDLSTGQRAEHGGRGIFMPVKKYQNKLFGVVKEYQTVEEMKKFTLSPEEKTEIVDGIRDYFINNLDNMFWVNVGPGKPTHQAIIVDPHNETTGYYIHLNSTQGLTDRSQVALALGRKPAYHFVPAMSSDMKMFIEADKTTK